MNTNIKELLLKYYTTESLQEAGQILYPEQSDNDLTLEQVQRILILAKEIDKIKSLDKEKRYNEY